MSKIILLISIYLVSGINSAMAQFTEKQIEELTVSGIYTALEPENYAVAKKSLELTEKFKSEDRISQICSIFDFIYKGWNYSLDPFGQEYFEKAGVSIYTLTGDCDDYAILMVSMIRSIGGMAGLFVFRGMHTPKCFWAKSFLQKNLIN
jgi:hypothetical protein